MYWFRAKGHPEMTLLFGASHNSRSAPRTAPRISIGMAAYCEMHTPPNPRAAPRMTFSLRERFFCDVVSSLEGRNLSAPDRAITIAKTLIARSAVFCRGGLVEHRLAQPSAPSIVNV